MFYCRCAYALSGSVVGNFNGYFVPGTQVTKEQFLHSIDKNAYEHPSVLGSRCNALTYILVDFFLQALHCLLVYCQIYTFLHINGTFTFANQDFILANKTSSLSV